MQLLVCDWLLKTRAEIWQQECDAAGSSISLPPANRILSGFQSDLNALRALSQCLKACLPRVSQTSYTVNNNNIY